MRAAMLKKIVERVADRRLCTCPESEVSLGGFALFSFQIPNLFEAEPAFDDKY
jgi:hypothetical protein